MAEFTTLAISSLVALEAPHTSDPSFNPAMILFDAVIQVSTGPMSHFLPQHAADRSGIRAMAVSGHPVRAKAHGGLGRAKEGLSGLHVAVLAQHGVDQVSVPVDRPIKVTPLAPDLQICLVDIPADARSAPHSVPALTQRLAHDRQQLGLPGAN